ncbi:cupredoxin domain-containing protein [Pseudomarimonas salicorniae]|uniref:Plastocyanin n=1 Tax=Pseudomarimonas salicorniae TaxID=2933270 RepID=A0ABT0GJI1_9GAMM|nr:hypothetical protein [Lysobacter sp. CAU 1642]MCK7594706.1 hypothetical protein [Lysobacter sp. CAU 1642]
MGSVRRLSGLVLAVLAALPLPVAAASLSGQVRLDSSGQALRASEAADAVVYFRPDAAFEPPAPMPPQSMSTRRKQFLPRVMAITPGTEVAFPNQDPILHNAFSSSAGNQFDTGVYGAGEGSRHRFDTPGLVKVYCNVHHAMSAHILVLDVPWFTRPDAEGRFRLDSLPEGPGTLVVFHDRASIWQKRVEIGGAPTEVEVQLSLTRRKVPPHMNKFGKPYGRGVNRY